MAKFSPGPGVAAVSGSIGGTVFSRNRYGAYMRYRAVPVNPDTQAQALARQAIAAASETWRSLTPGKRAAWATWCAGNPIVDTLGNAQILSANAGYCQINSRLLYVGEAQIDLPPTAAAPAPLATIGLETDLGVGDFELNYTATPLGAGVSLWLQAAVVNSAGINYVKNLMRIVDVSEAAKASPIADLDTLLVAKFGTLQVGQIVHVLASTFDSATGLLSTPLRASSVVVETS